MSSLRLFRSAALALLVAGCGFQPLYSLQHNQTANLAAVYVSIIPNRSGQLLRQALQSRLEGSASGVAKRYTLDVGYAESVQGIGVQSDNSTTRNRDIGNAVWSLHSADSAGVQIAGGTVRTLDGYNIVDEQFFYADLSEEAAERRLAEALADQIVQGLAVYFGTHARQG